MKRPAALPLIVILSLAVTVAAPFIGPRELPLQSILHPFSGSVESEIFWRIRTPRVLVAFLSGSALATAGMAFQAMFRNPLATPFTLGVASGASLGATLLVGLGLSFSLLGVPAGSFGAMAGALLAIFLVYSFTRARQGFSTSTLLLAGVAVSFFFSSLILFVQYMSDFTKSFQILHNLIGAIEVVGYGQVYQLLPFAATGVAVIVLHSHELNLLATGEDLAASRGVNVDSSKRVIFFAASLMVGGVVAVCGPIGFVGMMTPHICRLLLGQDHRNLSAAVVAFGGGFLTLCDTLARTLIAPAELPVGVITALLGGPFFFWLLLTGSAERGVI
ncbi:iron ABC transporter permease [bacterium]|nr:iron ABC transporter permease [bacterium]